MLVAAAAMLTILACSVSVNKSPYRIPEGTHEDSLRYLYSLPPDQWPAPFVDPGVYWQELGILPGSPLEGKMDSLRWQIELGKTLFFDTRLSGSNQISCASCHTPQLSWTDGIRKSLGHEQRVNRRNSPSLLNVWFYHRLFWDGRSSSLEDQAFAPINSETEMNSDMPEVIRKLRRNEGYRALFDSAFGKEGINPETMTQALAIFQRTLVGNKSAFDYFLEGKKDALSDEALRGLHVFRTKARCMNCHNGPLFTDNGFHNTGLSAFGTENEDLGRYDNTRKAEDRGKFKTPSLRDVMRTKPWMHDGSFDDMGQVIERYNAGAPPNFESSATAPTNDPLLKKLDLTDREKQDLIAFLQAITADPPAFVLPDIPK